MLDETEAPDEQEQEITTGEEPTEAPSDAELADMAMATLGIWPFLSGEVSKVRKYHLSDIAAIPRDVVKLARGVVNGTVYDMPETNIDYHKTLNLLSDAQIPQRIKSMVESFPPDMNVIAAAVSISATRVMQQLLEFMPKSEHQTLSGTTKLAPSDTRLWKFFSIIDVIDDPLSVFALMSNGALLRSQTAAVQAVYPELSKAISAALNAAIVKSKARKKSFELTPHAEYGIRIWSGQPPIERPMLVQAQANAAKLQEAKANQQKQMEPHKVSDRAKFDATQPQRSEADI